MSKPITPPDDDPELVRRIQQGDSSAESALIDKYSMGVWAILARWRVRGAVEATDLYQETWMAVISKIRKGELESPSALGSFIATTARFVLNGAYRYEKRRIHDEFEDEGLETPQPPQWMMIDSRFRARMIKQYLHELPAGHRDLLLMYFVSELSREEICGILGITSQILSRRLHSAKAAFRQFLENRMPDLGWDDDEERHT